jgi:hypothetical protein
LPCKYRSAVLLHHGEGRSIEEAAAELGWTTGELRGVLFRARQLLQGRLQQRGVALSLGMLALAGSESALPASLVDVMVRAALSFVVDGSAAAGVVSAAAAALAKGVLQEMFVTKVKIAAAAVLALTVIGLGVSGTDGQTERPAPPVVEKKSQSQAAVKALNTLPSDIDRLQGIWRNVKPSDRVGEISWITFKENNVTLTLIERNFASPLTTECPYKLIGRADPKLLYIQRHQPSGSTLYSILGLTADRLTLRGIDDEPAMVFQRQPEERKPAAPMGHGQPVAAEASVKDDLDKLWVEGVAGPKKDLDKLQGTWHSIAINGAEGRAIPDKETVELTIWDDNWREDRRREFAIGMGKNTQLSKFQLVAQNQLGRVEVYHKALDDAGYWKEYLHWLDDNSFHLHTADLSITFQRQPPGIRAEAKPGAAANAADAPKEAAINLSRVTYRLPNAKARALDSILREHVKGVTLETKVDGDSLTVTTTPEAQQRIGRFIPLVRGDPLKREEPAPVPPQPGAAGGTGPGAAPLNPPPR